MCENVGVDGGSKVRWMEPFPGMDEVGGKGDGIAMEFCRSCCWYTQRYGHKPVILA